MLADLVNIEFKVMDYFWPSLDAGSIIEVSYIREDRICLVYIRRHRRIEQIPLIDLLNAICTGKVDCFNNKDIVIKKCRLLLAEETHRDKPLTDLQKLQKSYVEASIAEKEAIAIRQKEWEEYFVKYIDKSTHCWRCWRTLYSYKSWVYYSYEKPASHPDFPIFPKCRNCGWLKCSCGACGCVCSS